MASLEMAMWSGKCPRSVPWVSICMGEEEGRANAGKWFSRVFVQFEIPFNAVRVLRGSTTGTLWE